MRRRLLLTVACLLVATLTAPAASAQAPECGTRPYQSVDELLECVTVEGVLRAPGGLPGDRRRQQRHPGLRHRRLRPSVDYVRDRLRTPATSAIQQFEFNAFAYGPSTLDQTPPAGVVCGGRRLRR